MWKMEIAEKTMSRKNDFAKSVSMLLMAFEEMKIACNQSQQSNLHFSCS